MVKNCKPNIINPDLYSVVVVQDIAERDKIPCKLRQDGMIAIIVDEEYTQYQIKTSIDVSKCNNDSWTIIQTNADQAEALYQAAMDIRTAMEEITESNSLIMQQHEENANNAIINSEEALKQANESLANSQAILFEAQEIVVTASTGWTADIEEKPYLSNEGEQRRIKQIVSYQPGTGELPELFRNRIGMYLAEVGYTNDPELAKNYKVYTSVESEVSETNFDLPVSGRGIFNFVKQEIADATTLAEGEFNPANLDEAISAKQVFDFYENKIIDAAVVEIDENDPSIAMLVMSANGETISSVQIPALGGGGGGGGTNAISMKLRATDGTTQSTVKDATLKFTWTSIDVESQSDTGNGTLQVVLNSSVILTQTIQQGNVSVNVSKFLLPGSNRFVVKVTDAYGNLRTLTLTVNLVQIALTSSYNITTANPGDLNFRYTPIGAIEKTIIFKIDGVEIGREVTTSSNRQMTFVIPKRPHGAYNLQVQAESVVDGILVKSNILSYDIMFVDQGNLTPIIAAVVPSNMVEQYQIAEIQYVVYTPGKNISNVTLSLNNIVQSQLQVDRTIQSFSIKPSTTESLNLKIQSGAASRTISFTVTPSEYNFVVEQNALQLELSPLGKSNSSGDRNQWKNRNITATLTDFDFTSTNGWTTDDYGVPILRVANKARVNIPLKVFGNDFKTTGKTIEIEFAVKDVADFTAELLYSWNSDRGLKVLPNKAIFKSEQTELDAYFKEEDRVKIAFTVQNNSSQANRLMFVYINGIMSAVKQYPTIDNFMQSVPQNITIGSDKATVDVYKIRIYDSDLNSGQILNNYIADIDDTVKKIDTYLKNDIRDDFGDISYAKALKYIPCMTIIGELPAYKGNKKTNKVIYIDQINPSNSFTAENVKNDVQGTSSQYYPRKNYKMEFKGGFTNDNLETTPGYKLFPNSIPATIFTHKADFAESSGTHNTGIAMMIEDALRLMNFRTPPQKENPSIRTAIEGLPMLIFHKLTESSSPVFVGKYNFNLDKGDPIPFGFEKNKAECWEVLNNTSDNVLFKTSDFTSINPQTGKPTWLNDFEGRFPKDSEDPTVLKRMHEWVTSCKNNPTKFKTELGDYFNKNFLLFYYITTELFAMVDQRAKNMMLAFFLENNKWICYPIFYDNDSILGLNNEGVIQFSYDVESQDTIGTGNVFNGKDSELWKLVETAFESDIKSMYQSIRTKDIYSFQKAILHFDINEAEHWSENIYNEDGYFKYIKPLTSPDTPDENGLLSPNGSYLYAAQGSREDHRRWWLANRFRYMDSRYDTGSYKQDFATFRTYTPSSWTGVTPNADFNITPIENGYVTAKWGSYITHKKVKKDTPIEFKAPAISFNDTETIIYGISRVSSLGDLAPKYLGTLDISKATVLKELKVGSQVAGYKNFNLTHVTFGNNRILKTVDVSNSPNLKGILNMESCVSIEKIYADGTNITGVQLPDGGVVTNLVLPSSVTNLTFRGQKQLTVEGIVLPTNNSVSTVVVENCANLSVSILLSMLNETTLDVVRFTGLTGSAQTPEMFLKLIGKKGIGDNGEVINNAVVRGTMTFQTAYQEDVDKLRAAFPDFNFTVTNINQYIVYETPAYGAAIKAVHGELTPTQAAAITNFGTPLKGITVRGTFPEMRFFTGVTTLADEAFMGWGGLSIVLPENIRNLGKRLFMNCPNLLSISINGPINIIPEQLIANTKTSVSFSPLAFKSIIVISAQAFYNSGNIEWNWITPPNVTSISSDAFSLATFKTFDNRSCIVEVNLDRVKAINVYASNKVTGEYNIQNYIAYAQQNLRTGDSYTTVAYRPESRPATTVKNDLILGSGTKILFINSVQGGGGRQPHVLENIPNNIVLNEGLEQMLFNDAGYNNSNDATLFAYKIIRNKRGIPKTVKILDQYGYNQDNETKYLYFSNALQKWTGQKVNNWQNLRAVRFDSVTPPEITGQSFTGNPFLLGIYVPDQSVAAYKAAANWNAIPNVNTLIKPQSQMADDLAADTTSPNGRGWRLTEDGLDIEEIPAT